MLSLLMSVAVVLTSSFVVQLNAQDVYGCNSSWVLLPGMGIYGGVVQPNVTTEDGCRAACFRNTTCQGIDWNPSNGDGNKCYLQWTQIPSAAFPGVNHWNFNRTAPCAGACGDWKSFANMGAYGGIEQSSVTTDEQCRATCVNNGSCVGIDWNSKGSTGHQCYLLFSRGPMYNASGLMHWEYNSTAGCQISCGSWTPTSNTGVYGGIEQPGVTIERDCRLTCMGNPNCIGVDWNPSNDVGHQCFVQTGIGQRYPSNGITHWEFNRTGSCSVDCLFAFTESPNTGIPGGSEQPNITNVTDCKRVCLMNQTCAGIDWNPGNGQGHQCYLHFTTGSRFVWNGVFHYDLDRAACIPDNGPEPNSSFSGAPPTGSCHWIRSPNSNIFGGVQDKADTLGGCMLSCQRVQGCVGFDWVDNNPSGSKCYRHVTQVGRVPANWGVDHYDLICNASTYSPMNIEMSTSGEHQ